MSPLTFLILASSFFPDHSGKKFINFIHFLEEQLLVLLIFSTAFLFCISLNSTLIFVLVISAYEGLICSFPSFFM